MLSGCRLVGFWAICPHTFIFFVVLSLPLAAGHILTLGNFEDPDVCPKLSVCQDSDVEWMPPGWILGRTSLHFHVVFVLAVSPPLATGHIYRCEWI